MATVDKNFRIKHGLVVEGSTGTINGNNILTENSSDQYIINLIGGQATSTNTPDAVVKRDGNGSFVANEVTVNSLVLNGTDLSTTLNNLDTNAQNYADTAESNANAYTDSAISTEVTNRNNAISTASGNLEDYADNVASNALSSANSYTDSAISQEVSDRNSAITTASNNLEDYADNVALIAQQNAENYADSLASNYDAAGAAQTAESNANSYTDSQISTEVTNRNSAISTAQSNAETYADNAASAALDDANTYTDSAISTEVTNRNSAIATAKSEAISSANSYTDGKVADLVDSAPALLDTLNELAAAIADNPNYASDVANLVGTKADTTYVDSEISSLDSAAQGYANTAQSNAESFATTAANNAQSNAEDYADTAASNAQSAAQSYADGLASNYDAAGAASAAQSAAETYTDNAISNGNSSATPTYAGINLDWVSKLIAGYASGSGTLIPVQWSSNYGTAKFTVHVRDGVHSQASEVLIARDSSNNIHMTEYAIVTTNGILADVSAVYDSGSMKVTVTPTNGHTSVECAVSGSAVIWAD